MGGVLGLRLRFWGRGLGCVGTGYSVAAGRGEWLPKEGAAHGGR